MNIFERPNTSHGWVCPICKTSEEKKVILIGIAGTQEGNIVEAEQFHCDCIELRWHKDKNLIGMAWD